MRSCLVSTCCLLAVFLIGCGGSTSNDAASNDSAPAAPDAAAHNTLTAEEKANGWQLLFDGETTQGWHNYNADTLSSKWQVQDGALMLTGRGGGDIITSDTTFGSFELKMDWKISECGNNGVFFHAKEGYNAVWAGAPEIQILDNACAEDNEDPTHRAGANYDLHAPSQDVTKPAGQWNNLRVVVDDGHVQHFLNGTKIVDYELWTDAWRQKVENSKFASLPDYGMAKAGGIALQDHGNRVWFRNIKIRPLPDDNASASM